MLWNKIKCFFKTHRWYYYSMKGKKCRVCSRCALIQEKKDNNWKTI